MSINNGNLGINELLQVFMGFEQPDDKLLQPAIVHGSKRLQGLADTRTTFTNVVDVIPTDNEATED